MKQSNSGRDTIQDSNVIHYLGDDPTSGIIVKTYRRKPFNFKMVKYRLLSALGQEVPVEYRPPAHRRDFEYDCLAHWQAKGFSVPEIREIADHAHARGRLPAIGLAPVQGERLDQFLTNPGHGAADKLSAIAEIYREMYHRHCIAIFEQNHRLIHYDANLRNLIISQGKVVHIDFEMGHLTEDIDKSATREVKKFSLQVLNIIDSKMTDQVLDLLLTHYNMRHVVLKIIDEELRRPFLTIHIKRDLKRKQKHPGLITKLDIAFRLEQKLGLKDSPRPTNEQAIDLVKAIETSWDGKYYQSLDDSDYRARDMNHRYTMMKVPDSFENGSVLDIGCNIGRICVDATKRGASRAIGIDHRKDVVDAMNRHFQENRIGVSLYTFDINDGVQALNSLIGPAPFEYVFVLSIWSHVDKQKLWDIINTYCSKVCYFEDNSPSRVRSLGELKHILTENLHFSRIEFMGFTTDRGVRAIYRLEK
ncbi:MAG: class I SAM-dependent methyltransferase [Desulfatitalea sp.]